MGGGQHRGAAPADDNRDYAHQPWPCPCRPHLCAGVLAMTIWQGWRPPAGQGMHAAELSEHRSASCLEGREELQPILLSHALLSVQHACAIAEYARLLCGCCARRRADPGLCAVAAARCAGAAEAQGLPPGKSTPPQKPTQLWPDANPFVACLAGMCAPHSQPFWLSCRCPTMAWHAASMSMLCLRPLGAVSLLLGLGTRTNH